MADSTGEICLPICYLQHTLSFNAVNFNVLIERERTREILMFILGVMPPPGEGRKHLTLPFEIIY